MAPENITLRKILFRNNEFCSLCFENLINDDAIQFQDKVVTDEEDIIMLDIIRFMLPLQASLKIETDGICSKCARGAITSYKFIKMVKKNWETLNNTIESVNSCFEYNSDEINSCKTLFITLNTKDFASKKYCDSTSIFVTKNSALKRFQKLSYIKNEYSNSTDVDASLMKTESDIPDNNLYLPKLVVSKKKGYKNSSSVPISEMLYNKNDDKNYKCKVCLQTYPTSYNLKQHFIRVHAPKTFKCPDCPRRYGSACILHQHRHESHTNSVCSQCGKTYNNRHSLKVHEMGHKLKLVCKNCGRHYKRKSTYNKHVMLNECNRQRMSSSQAKFTCDICNKKFCQKATLRVHIIFEHGKGKAHECIWCNKRFYAQSKLNAHIVKHTKEKNFTCNQCGGKFVTKESLLYHTRIHTGDKPYKCDYCDNRFLSASRRMEHVRRHHMDVIHECDICHSKFKVKSCLIKHKKKHVELNSKLI